MTYNVGLLSADISPIAELKNAQLLGPKTMGIEVTSPELAPRCGLGNHDPQHTEGKKISAIKAGIDRDLPPDGSTLVTIKPDKDSIGTMALWVLRLEGSLSSVDLKLVDWIDVIDCYGTLDAKKHRPDLAKIYYGNNLVNAMNVIIHVNLGRFSLADKVSLVTDILTHEMRVDEVDYYASLMPNTPPQDFTTSAEIHYPVPIMFISTFGYLREARYWGGKQKAPVVVVNDTKTNGWNVVWKNSRFDGESFSEQMMIREASARNIPVDELLARGLYGGSSGRIWCTPSGRGRDSKIENLKQTILQVAESCYRRPLVSI